MTKMTELEFTNLYHHALYKVAIGIHVIRTVGEVHGYSEYVVTQSIQAWCNILADGLQLNIQTVITDANERLKYFPKRFLASKEFAELMAELTLTLSQAKCLPPQMR